MRTTTTTAIISLNMFHLIESSKCAFSHSHSSVAKFAVSFFFHFATAFANKSAIAHHLDTTDTKSFLHDLITYTHSLRLMCQLYISFVFHKSNERSVEKLTEKRARYSVLPALVLVHLYICVVHLINIFGFGILAVVCLIFQAHLHFAVPAKNASFRPINANSELHSTVDCTFKYLYAAINVNRNISVNLAQKGE